MDLIYHYVVLLCSRKGLYMMQTLHECNLTLCFIFVSLLFTFLSSPSHTVSLSGADSV